MSAATRQAAQKLRRKFAKAFDVPLEKVLVYETDDDNALVGAEYRPDLPTWSTGGAATFDVALIRVQKDPEP